MDKSAELWYLKRKQKTVLRLLLNTGIALILIAGGCCDSLAAAACLHPGCGAVAAAPAHSPSHGDGVQAGHHEVGHGEPGGHDHGTAAPSGAVRPSGASITGSHDSSCDHCMSRSEPDTAAPERRACRPKDGGREAAPPARVAAAMQRVNFTPEVIPSQGAPPGRGVRTHLLLSVFRI